MAEDTPALRSILFVDDEPKIVDGLRRTLRSHRKVWEMTFVTSPEEALEKIRSTHFDVIVSDMRMPGMNGAELLEHVRRESPATVRIILSGQSEASAIMRSIGPSHQFLSKPCDPLALEQAIQRTCELRSHLSNPVLANVVGSIETLPSLPSIYQELVQAINSEASMTEIGEIIARDLGMCVKLLKLVNSSYFGPRRQVNDPVRAVTMLGVETIQSLVLGVKIFDQFPESALEGEGIESLWKRSTAASTFARAICLSEGADPVMVSQASLGAFLHDIGALVLQSHLPAEMAKVDARMKDGLSRIQAELEVLGATHGDVGGHLASLWGFTDPIVEALTFHSRPSQCSNGGRSALTFVHVAQALAISELPDIGAELPGTLDLTYLQGAGVLERIPDWIKRCHHEAATGKPG